MPERSSSTSLTSETTGWGRKHLAISGVSHQPLVQTAHHANAIGPSGSGVQDNGGGFVHHAGIDFQSLRQQDTPGSSSSAQIGFTNPIHELNPYDKGLATPNSPTKSVRRSTRKKKTLANLDDYKL
jgi:hypothetical protein